MNRWCRYLDLDNGILSYIVGDLKNVCWGCRRGLGHIGDDFVLKS